MLIVNYYHRIVSEALTFFFFQIIFVPGFDTHFFKQQQHTRKAAVELVKWLDEKQKLFFFQSTKIFT